jgi:hypothetical protein
MVSDVQGWLGGSLPNFGWLLQNDSETTPTTFRAFYTKEGAFERGVPQFAPELIVSFVTPDWVDRAARAWLESGHLKSITIEFYWPKCRKRHVPTHGRKAWRRWDAKPIVPDPR